MTLFKLVSSLTGYITVVIFGTSPERLMNMASSRGIWLWNIKWISQDRIQASIRLSGVRPLRHIARETGCRFTIEGRYGLPFFLSRLRKRKTMAVGGILFLILLYMLSSFIWFIEVTGNVTVKDGEILAVARRAGLSTGVLKWYLDSSAVEKAIQERIPKVSWAGVYINGTRATVEIVEKKLPPDGTNLSPANVVAEKDGLIKEILVLQGHPAVTEGQTVEKGQVLISGEIPPPETEKEDESSDQDGENSPEEKVSRYVHAQGIVRARVWYEGYAEVPLVKEGFRPTGKEISRFGIKIGDKEIILAGPEKIPFQRYDRIERSKRLPSWRNINFPVEINTERYVEFAYFKKEISPSAARKKALKLAIADAEKRISRDARLLSREVKEIEGGREDGVVRIKVLFEVLEDIGREKPFKP